MESGCLPELADRFYGRIQGLQYQVVGHKGRTVVPVIEARVGKHCAAQGGGHKLLDEGHRRLMLVAIKNKSEQNNRHTPS